MFSVKIERKHTENRCFRWEYTENIMKIVVCGEKSEKTQRKSIYVFSKNHRKTVWKSMFSVNYKGTARKIYVLGENAEKTTRKSMFPVKIQCSQNKKLCCWVSQFLKFLAFFLRNSSSWPNPWNFLSHRWSVLLPTRCRQNTPNTRQELHTPH